MTQRVVTYTYGTGNPALPDGSIDVRDGIDNLQSFDIFMNADEDTYNQRDGEVVQTVAGAIRSLGFKHGTGDFTTGFTVNPGQRDYAWYDPVSKNWYSYLGVIPTIGHVVSPGTNPVGDSNWAPRTDELLREELANIDGFGVIGSASYSDVRAHNGTAHTIRVYGRSNIFDGAHGLFLLDATDTTSVDNDGTILVDANGGRWKRQRTGQVTMAWFAKGDGVTDDTLAFENALVAADGEMVYVPPATYVVNNMSKPPRLEGDHANRAILICTLPNSCVLLNPAGSQHPANSVIVKNLILDTTSTNCNAYRADYAGGLSYTDSALFYNVETSQKFKASYVGNFIFSKWIYCADGKYGGAPTGVHQFLKAVQYGQVNDNLFDSCRIYHSGDGTNKIKPIEMYWANGNTFRKCNFEFCYGGVMKLTGGYSNHFENCWIEIGLVPSLPSATLPTELFELEYASSGAGSGSQPRSILLDKCVIAIGTTSAPFGLQNGGAIFKSTTGSGGGEWGLVGCTIWGDRPGAINLYTGPFPENRIVWSNVASASGVDPAGSFADFYTSVKIIGQKSVTYTPEIYVIQTTARPTHNVQTGFCVVNEKTISVHFDVGWTAMPNTGSYSLAVTLPSGLRTPLADTWFTVDRYSGMSATINNYEIWGKVAAGDNKIQLFIKPAHSPDAVTQLPPVHSATGRLTGSVEFLTP